MAQPYMMPMAAKVGQPVQVKKLRQEKAHHQKRNTTFYLPFYVVFNVRLHLEKEEKGKPVGREKVLQPVPEEELGISISDIFPQTKVCLFNFNDFKLRFQ